MHIYAQAVVWPFSRHDFSVVLMFSTRVSEYIYVDYFEYIHLLKQLTVSFQVYGAQRSLSVLGMLNTLVLI